MPPLSEIDLMQELALDLGQFRGRPVVPIPDGWRVVAAEAQYVDPFLAVVDVMYVTDHGDEQKTLVLRRSAPAVLAVRGEASAREMLVVKQVRHGTGRVSTELPGGMGKRGETDEEIAARELFEEAGVEVDPSQLKLLTVVSRDPARSVNLLAPIYLAELPASTPTRSPQAEHGEHFVGKAWVPLTELFTQMARGELTDAVLLAALGVYLALPYA